MVLEDIISMNFISSDHNNYSRHLLFVIDGKILVEDIVKLGGWKEDGNTAEEP